MEFLITLEGRDVGGDLLNPVMRPVKINATKLFRIHSPGSYELKT